MHIKPVKYVRIKHAYLSRFLDPRITIESKSEFRCYKFIAMYLQNFMVSHQADGKLPGESSSSNKISM